MLHINANALVLKYCSRVLDHRVMSPYPYSSPSQKHQGITAPVLSRTTLLIVPVRYGAVAPLAPSPKMRTAAETIQKKLRHARNVPAACCLFFISISITPELHSRLV